MQTTIILALAVVSSFVQILPINGNSERLMDAWKKINTNYANDIQQVNAIYKEIKDEQHAFEELRSMVERFLRMKNAELLANAISSNDVSISANKLRERLEKIIDTYHYQLVNGILTQAIDEIILIKKLPQIPDLLWGIYQKNDTKSFQNMLRFQIQLYWSFSKGHHIDEIEFLQNYAYLLYKIQNEPLYTSVNLNLKSSVQHIIDKLPTSMKYLYFKPYFCLLNAKYEKYIYSAIEAKVDPLSRYIWLWNDTRTMDDTGYIKAQVTESVPSYERKFNVALRSTKYHMYYYMMDSTKLIAGWDTMGTPLNYIWDLEFLENNRVSLSQNDYLMCAVELHDNERRNVAGRKKGQVSSAGPECQWLLGACIFK